MAKRWTEEELKTLIDARKKNIPYKKIPIDRSVAAMKTKIRDSGLFSSNNKWTEYEEKRLKQLAGFSIAYIAKELGRSESSIYKKLKQTIKPVKVEYSDEYLLDLVRKYKTQDNLNYNRLETEPSAPVITKRFGSWNQALIEAGESINKYGLNPEIDTIVYLVKFEKFFKVGLTQRSVAERLRGFPKFTLIDEIILDYSSAKQFETDILNYVKPYKIIGDLPNGNEECFTYKFDNFNSVINEIYLKLHVRGGTENRSKS